MTQDPAKILLVADGEDNLTVMAAILTLSDVEVLSVSSAAVANELIQRQDFALVIVDMQMPEADGFKLAQMLGSNDLTRHVPLVGVTTAGVEAASAVTGCQLDTMDFMYKPLTVDTVQSKVRVFVDLYRCRLAAQRHAAELEQAHLRQQVLLEQLQQAQGELEKALELRDQSLSVVSHELRTPLNTLKLEWYARRIYIENGEFDAFTPDKLTAMVESDERQLNRLVCLINDMTDVSRIRTGQLSLHTSEGSVATVVQRSVD